MCFLTFTLRSSHLLFSESWDEPFSNVFKSPFFLEGHSEALKLVPRVKIILIINCSKLSTLQVHILLNTLSPRDLNYYWGLLFLSYGAFPKGRKTPRGGSLQFTV